MGLFYKNFVTTIGTYRRYSYGRVILFTANSSLLLAGSYLGSSNPAAGTFTGGVIVGGSSWWFIQSVEEALEDQWELVRDQPSTIINTRDPSSEVWAQIPGWHYRILCTKGKKKGETLVEWETDKAAFE